MGLKSGGGNAEAAAKDAKIMRGVVRRSSLLSLRSDDDE